MGPVVKCGDETWYFGGDLVTKKSWVAATKIYIPTWERVRDGQTSLRGERRYKQKADLESNLKRGGLAAPKRPAKAVIFI